MAMGVLVGGAVIKGIGAVKQGKATKAGAAEQARLDEENRQLYLREVEESVRRTEETNRQVAGMASTQIGASGFGSGSSMDAYMQTLESQQQSDVDWMRESGASTSAIMEREASARYRNTRAHGKAQTISGIGGAVSGVGGAFKW